jgi:hypothetical protein
MLTSLMVILGLVATSLGQPTGEILCEFWFGIGGTAVSDLTGHPDYPDNPHDGVMLTEFNTPGEGNWGVDNYGARVRGYLYPPADGDYTFWVAGDDFCELYLSTDDDPANATLIAEVPGWTSYLEWAKYPEQQSAPITLVGGGKYYIEGLMKEGGGGDNMQVGWQGGPIAEPYTIIDGAYLSPLPWPDALKKAKNPDPADGAVDVDAGTLAWTAGATIVSNVVYLSTDATIDDADKIAETDMSLVAITVDPGVTYYWRVDGVDDAGVVYEGDVWSFTTTPLEAHFPDPADGATNVPTDVTLRWTAGKVVVMHDVYFGTDEAAVAAANMGSPEFKGKVMVTSYSPGELELFTTYYWRVDEFTPTGTVPGPVWSFSTPNQLIIEGGEVTLNYDNTAEPYVSEAIWDVTDLTAGGLVSDLTLNFQGLPSNLSIDEATGTYEIAGSGADIWGSSDQFHYVYQELTGDATITARVVSNGTGSNTWAKGGVMIRESTAPDSKHMIMGMTGGDGGGIAFQGRIEAAGANSSSLHGDVTASPPYWVRLTREGNTITAYHSADGEAWELFTDTSPDTSGGAISNPIDVEMADPVLIGLFVTSHAAGEVRTYTFDNVSVEGDVGALVSLDIASVSGNSAESIYVAITDSTGAVASVPHPYPEATQIDTVQEWTIPLGDFAGVDPTAATTLAVGVGNGLPGGTGAVTISSMSVVEPTGVADIIWVTGGYDDNGDGAADDLEWIDILKAQGYSVDSSSSYVDLDDASIAKLNAAKLIIVSRCSNSGDYDDGDEIAQWNAITTPMIVMTAYNVRSSRWLWVDSTSILNLATETMVLADGTEIPGINAEVGTTSFIDADPGNGTILAVGDGLPWIIEWEAGVEYYEGSGQIAGGPRVFFAAGTQETDEPNVGRGEMNLSPEALAVYLEKVASFIPLADITKPGDKAVGVPDDGDWPGAEHPALAIDDNVSTKYLHFKGDFEPDPGTGGSGIQITPYGGPSIVTGLTLTTANDVPGRDPIAFELSGSNDGIGGPYTLIAAGDVVDFAQADEWPRFTKNETPIEFDNLMAYSHYQLIFTAIRGPVGGSVNSMQIAEIELLGSYVPAALVKINFQQTGGDVPSGYLPDGGEVFADRGNGFSYGWNMDSTGGARNRNNAAAPDERYDTCNHLEKGEHRIWEIALPNGIYDVYMVCGDASYTTRPITWTWKASS